MRKFVYLFSLIVLLSGCAATGFDVLEINRKILPKGVKGYYSSPIEIELKNIEETANFKLEFKGTSSATPVMVKLSPPSRVIIFPMGSSLPKYFIAVDSVTTTEWVSVRTPRGFPLINLKEKKLKKFFLTHHSSFSLNFLFL